MSKTYLHQIAQYTRPGLRYLPVVSRTTGQRLGSLGIGPGPFPIMPKRTYTAPSPAARLNALGLLLPSQVQS